MPLEFDGEKYKKASSHQKEWANKILAELHFAGNEGILDLGCGDGTITHQLAEMVPHGEVVGIDASKGMITTSLKYKKARNVHFELKDINDINYKEQFDFVFSNATLHWVKDHRKLLNTIYQALKDRGKIRFNFAADGNCSHFYRVVRQAMTVKRFSDYFEGFSWPWYMPTIEEYQQLARETKFSNIEVWGEKADRFFDDGESLTKWIDQPSIVPFLQPLPEVHKQEFRDHVVKQMIEETVQQDGRCFETFRRVNIRAIKIQGTVQES
jgi:trans-aconitate 2-methyltransferase